ELWNFWDEEFLADVESLPSLIGCRSSLWNCIVVRLRVYLRQQSAHMNKTPPPFYIPLDRRRFLKSLAIASAGFTIPGFLAEALTITPQVTQGPYYPRLANIPL